MKLRLLALLMSLTLVASACSGGDEEPKDDKESTKGESTTVTQVSPLTGQEFAGGAPPTNPVFVVKVENSKSGSPQYGVNQADLVVEEMVEGGITRLAALYYSTLPSKIGHVRSLRGTDAGIAAPVAAHVVASGGAGPAYSVINAAGLTTYTEDNNAPGFSTDSAKKRPYNRLLDLTAVASQASATTIPGPYFQFTPAGEAPAAPAGARPVTSGSVTFSSSHTTSFGLVEGGWARTNGFAAPGEEFVANNLVVIYAPERDAGYKDPAGNRVPETIFEGSGSGLVVIGGQAVDVTWTKPSLGSTVTFADSAGNPVTIPAGKTWIELVSQDRGSATFQ
ncbi:DUF3048 domain-containing protein [Aeromicrobium sp. Leaf350]|uniref:DUF3048 domain-containing protein n=1 Tax=Aeromicrobium sp. Leaf350 TaxID=2876565 RepID=UPI001E2958B7|nr:DUF3048 domain-containing protein [Aeromicrobium sp. Leaf350]